MAVKTTKANRTRHSARTRGGMPRSNVDLAMVPPRAKNAADPRAAA
jgi:hypothetical protein